jgi:hypothetical protein
MRDRVGGVMGSAATVPVTAASWEPSMGEEKEPVVVSLRMP